MNNIFKKGLTLITMIFISSALFPIVSMAATTKSITYNTVYDLDSSVSHVVFTHAGKTQNYGDDSRGPAQTLSVTSTAYLKGIKANGTTTTLMTSKAGTSSVTERYDFSTSDINTYTSFKIEWTQSKATGYGDRGIVSSFTSAKLYYKSTYTLTYDANGGSNAPVSSDIIVGESATISSVKPLRDKYDFVSWNTAQDGSGTAFVPGDSLTITENTTLYAQWRLQTPYFGGFQAPSENSGNLTLIIYIQKGRTNCIFSPFYKHFLYNIHFYENSKNVK